jgi:hypothetical protein
LNFTYKKAKNVFGTWNKQLNRLEDATIAYDKTKMIEIETRKHSQPFRIAGGGINAKQILFKLRLERVNNV